MELKNEKFTNLIKKIHKNSIAEELGIEVGDILLSINEEKIEDVIEYEYLTADNYLEVEILKKNGEILIYEIDKDFDEELGIEFENAITSSVQTCRNKCIFCFIDQLPKGMRKTLYIKDDDSRLSFLQGNFITMTNMGQKEIDKMIKYHISPVNISVHTTNCDLRKRMLNNKDAGNILQKMTQLKNANIDMNAQIVLIPNVNDGKYLEETLSDLEKLYPNLKSIAIVPVGVTKFREHLPNLELFDKKKSENLIKFINKYQNKYLDMFGTRFVFLSDEFYVMSGIKRPSHEEYEGYHQLENGVGLMTKQEFEFENQMSKIHQYKKNRTLSIATGESAFEFISDLCHRMEKKFDNLEVKVYKINNDFFGRTITVSGLVTAEDMLNQLKGEDLGEELIIPKVMLKADEDIFLDSMTLKDFEKKLGTKVRVINIDGNSFVKNILDL